MPAGAAVGVQLSAWLMPNGWFGWCVVGSRPRLLSRSLLVQTTAYAPSVEKLFTTKESDPLGPVVMLLTWVWLLPAALVPSAAPFTVSMNAPLPAAPLLVVPIPHASAGLGVLQRLAGVDGVNVQLPLLLTGAFVP